MTSKDDERFRRVISDTIDVLGDDGAGLPALLSGLAMCFLETAESRSGDSVEVCVKGVAVLLVLYNKAIRVAGGIEGLSQQLLSTGLTMQISVTDEPPKPKVLN